MKYKIVRVLVTALFLSISLSFLSGDKLAVFAAHSHSLECYVDGVAKHKHGLSCYGRSDCPRCDGSVVEGESNGFSTIPTNGVLYYCTTCKTEAKITGLIESEESRTDYEHVYGVECGHGTIWETKSGAYYEHGSSSSIRIYYMCSYCFDENAGYCSKGDLFYNSDGTLADSYCDRIVVVILPKI